MLGLGITQLGIIPFGSEDVQPAVALPSNLPQARDLDQNGDYSVNAQNEFVSTNWIRQAVIIALSTIAGSMSTDIKFGNQIPLLGVIDITFERRLKSSVNKALSHLVPKYVRINSIDIEIHPLGRVEYSVTYSNLYTKTSETVTRNIG